MPRNNFLPHPDTEICRSIDCRCRYRCFYCRLYQQLTLLCSLTPSQTCHDDSEHIPVRKSRGVDIWIQPLRHQISAEWIHMSGTPALLCVISYLKLGFRQLDKFNMRFIHLLNKLFPVSLCCFDSCCSVSQGFCQEITFTQDVNKWTLGSFAGQFLHSKRVRTL